MALGADSGVRPRELTFNCGAGSLRFSACRDSVLAPDVEAAGAGRCVEEAVPGVVRSEPVGQGPGDVRAVRASGLQPQPGLVGVAVQALESPALELEGGAAVGALQDDQARRLPAHVDTEPPPPAVADRHFAATPDALVWHENPTWAPEVSTDAERASVSAGSSELAQARAEVLPALRRLLADYSPTTRMALLAELQSGAVAELTADS
jgi:hypothetical protein